MEHRRSTDGDPGRRAIRDHQPCRARSPSHGDATGLGHPAALRAPTPWQYYDSISLRPYPQQDEGGITWSAADIGRLLSALQACRNHYPEQGVAINRLLSGWQLAHLFQQRPYAPMPCATPRAGG
ncbi:DUF3131 domain-containing protein [Edwardsiella tarda]